MKYKLIPLTTDAVVVKDNKILLVKRKKAPFKNFWALPGGFVNYGERTEDACLRELKEETSINGIIKGLVGVYSDPNRDPRHHTISIIYIVKWKSGTIKAGDDAKDAKQFDIKKLPNLAFDHSKIIRNALSSDLSAEAFLTSVALAKEVAKEEVPLGKISKDSHKLLNNKLDKQIKKYDNGKKIIFVSQAATNMIWARLICKFVLSKGHVPVNYFTIFGNFVHEIADLKTMIDSINSVIVRCDQLWVFGNISKGMWHEVKMCKELKMPIKYFSIKDLPTKIRRIKINQIGYTPKFAKIINKPNKFVPIEKM